MNLKNKKQNETNELIYETEIDRLRHRKPTWLSKGKGSGGGIN